MRKIYQIRLDTGFDDWRDFMPNAPERVAAVQLAKLMKYETKCSPPPAYRHEWRTLEGKDVAMERIEPWKDYRDEYDWDSYYPDYISVVETSDIVRKNDSWFVPRHLLSTHHPLFGTIHPESDVKYSKMPNKPWTVIFRMLPIKSDEDSSDAEGFWFYEEVDIEEEAQEFAWALEDEI